MPNIMGGMMGGGFPAPPSPPPTTSFDGDMTLFISGKDSGATSKPLNLFIRGGNPPVGKSLDLTVWNINQTSVNYLDLYVKGAGETPGYAPFSSSLNLWVQRGPNAGMTLFVCNNGIANSLPLSITGHGFISTSLTPRVETIPSSLFGRYRPAVIRYNVQAMSDAPGAPTEYLPLFIEGFGGSMNDSLDLFVSGVEGTEVTNSMTLAIPNVTGGVADTLTLYTHGFNY